MRYRVRHETEHRYAEPVSFDYTSAHLRPRPLPYQEVRDFRLHVTPEVEHIAWRQDHFGNAIAIFHVTGHHDRLRVVSTATVTVRPRPTPQRFESLPWEQVRDAVADDVSPRGLGAFEFAFDSRLAAGSTAYAAYVRDSFSPERPLVEALRELNDRVHHDWVFDPEATDVATPVDEVFRQRRGVCQDFTHLVLAMLRTLGLPARYVSGYLRTEPPPGQPRLIGADASHAWVSAYLGEGQWLDLDPTNGCVVGTDHVTIAWGRDYADVTPVKGLILGSGGHTVAARVDLTPTIEASEATLLPGRN
jgi:transglutaminase-like putative cysteine protease